MCVHCNLSGMMLLSQLKDLFRAHVKKEKLSEETQAVRAVSPGIREKIDCLHGKCS